MEILMKYIKILYNGTDFSILTDIIYMWIKT